ncbi:hypothetical protein FQA47_017260 [Oryzias melastigma]|uniref:Uncharacterized protein n=1 Tax=Oryzias melastigma TaxID=30732 RepID=A0A834F6D0_ORYME|nr:hypothetical protein FQA47_017260 [Oryzias melastigma]
MLEMCSSETRLSPPQPDRLFAGSGPHLGASASQRRNGRSPNEPSPSQTGFIFIVKCDPPPNKQPPRDSPILNGGPLSEEVSCVTAAGAGSSPRLCGTDTELVLFYRFVCQNRAQVSITAVKNHLPPPPRRGGEGGDTPPLCFILDAQTVSAVKYLLELV